VQAYSVLNAIILNAIDIDREVLKVLMGVRMGRGVSPPQLTMGVWEIVVSSPSQVCREPG